MKYVPNIISILRIFLAAILLFLEPLTLFFLIVYILCGLSDILDGCIARKTNTMSQVGATLDSIADVVFSGIILVIFIPIIKLPMGIIIWILSIAFVRVASAIIGFCKYNTFAFLHTYTNKATGLMLFCFPLAYNVVGITVVGVLICSVASISAIEELLINITSKELFRDIKSIFTKYLV